MAAKNSYVLSLQKNIQLTCKQRVRLSRKAYTALHSQGSVKFIRRLNFEAKHGLGGLLPALQCVD